MTIIRTKADEIYDLVYRKGIITTKEVAKELSIEEPFV